MLSLTLKPCTHATYLRACRTDFLGTFSAYPLFCVRLPLLTVPTSPPSNSEADNGIGKLTLMHFCLLLSCLWYASLPDPTWPTGVKRITFADFSCKLLQIQPIRGSGKRPWNCWGFSNYIFLSLFEDKKMESIGTLSWPFKAAPLISVWRGGH